MIVVKICFQHWNKKKYSVDVSSDYIIRALRTCRSIAAVGTFTIPRGSIAVILNLEIGETVLWCPAGGQCDTTIS